MKEFIGIIYRATNLINGKVYIGQTTNTIKRRSLSHKREAFINNGNTFFHRAIRKYGFYSFRWEIIEYCSTLEKLFEREIYWIAVYNSTNSKKGYNMSEGGRNPRLRGSKNHNYKRIWTEDELKNLSLKLTGRPSPNLGIRLREETKEKIRQANIGKRYSEETNKKKGRSKYGEKNSMWGKRGELHHGYKKPRTAETKQKISETSLKRGSQQGEKNGNASEWIITYSFGYSVIIKSLKSWARENNLSECMLKAKKCSKKCIELFNIIEVRKIVK